MNDQVDYDDAYDGFDGDGDGDGYDDAGPFYDVLLEGCPEVTAREAYEQLAAERYVPFVITEVQWLGRYAGRAWPPSTPSGTGSRPSDRPPAGRPARVRGAR